MNKPSHSTLIIWRSAAFGLGVMVLFWLPVEDQSTLVPSLLAIVAAIAASVLANQSYKLRLPLAGFLGGLIISPITLLLMAFKTGLHGHGAPDFTAQQLLQVIQFAPLWTLAGGLLGWGWQGLAHKRQS